MLPHSMPLQWSTPGWLGSLQVLPIALLLLLLLLLMGPELFFLETKPSLELQNLEMELKRIFVSVPLLPESWQVLVEFSVLLHLPDR